jgi:hypothetical protein
MTINVNSSRITLGAIALLFVMAAILPCSSTAQPQPKSFGFGLMLGEPAGLSLRGSLGGKNSWDGAIGTSWFGRLHVHADYLWAIDVFNSRKAGLYLGLGGVIGFGRGKGVVVKGKKGQWYYYEDEDATAIGVRVVGGINGMPFSAPVEFFLELAPIIGLVPTTGVGTGFSIGVRYYP